MRKGTKVEVTDGSGHAFLVGEVVKCLGKRDAKCHKFMLYLFANREGVEQWLTAEQFKKIKKVRK